MWTPSLEEAAEVAATISTTNSNNSNKTHKKLTKSANKSRLNISFPSTKRKVTSSPNFNKNNKNTESKSNSNSMTFLRKSVKYLQTATNYSLMEESKPKLIGFNTSRMWTEKFSKHSKKVSKIVLSNSTWWLETPIKTFSPFLFSLLVPSCRGMTLRNWPTSPPHHHYLKQLPKLSVQ